MEEDGFYWDEDIENEIKMAAELLELSEAETEEETETEDVETETEDEETETEDEETETEGEEETEEVETENIKDNILEKKVTPKEIEYPIFENKQNTSKRERRRMKKEKPKIKELEPEKLGMKLSLFPRPIIYNSITKEQELELNRFLKDDQTSVSDGSIELASQTNIPCRPNRVIINDSNMYSSVDIDIEDEFKDSASTIILRLITWYSEAHHSEIKTIRKKYKKLSSRMQIKKRQIYELHIQSRGKKLMLRSHLCFSAIKDTSFHVTVPEKCLPFINTHPRYKISRQTRYSCKPDTGLSSLSSNVYGVSLPPTTRRIAPIRHTTKNTATNVNVGFHIPKDAVDVLLNLQHRDLTPEDYDLLLRLDESLTPKTVDTSVIKTLASETLICKTVPLESCSICLENYEEQQTKTTLPCGHYFHQECIKTWLLKESVNCPLDGKPIDVS